MPRKCDACLMAQLPLLCYTSAGSDAANTQRGVRLRFHNEYSTSILRTAIGIRYTSSVRHEGTERVVLLVKGRQGTRDGKFFLVWEQQIRNEYQWIATWLEEIRASA